MSYDEGHLFFNSASELTPSWGGRIVARFALPVRCLSGVPDESWDLVRCANAGCEGGVGGLSNPKLKTCFNGRKICHNHSCENPGMTVLYRYKGVTESTFCLDLCCVWPCSLLPFHHSGHDSSFSKISHKWMVWIILHDFISSIPNVCTFHPSHPQSGWGQGRKTCRVRCNVA